MRQTLLLIVLLATTAAACDVARADNASNSGDAPDARHGREVIERFGCGGCHVIPGVRDANGWVGPPLMSFARREYIAGELPNTFENAMRFIESPSSIHPRTAMPTPGIGNHEVRDVVAYLYTLR